MNEEELAQLRLEAVANSNRIFPALEKAFAKVEEEILQTFIASSNDGKTFPASNSCNRPFLQKLGNGDFLGSLGR